MANRRLRRVALLLAVASLGTVPAAQQAAAPVRAGTPELPIPELVTYVPPMSPWLVTLEYPVLPPPVSAEAVIGPGGLVEDVRLLQPEESLRLAPEPGPERNARRMALVPGIFDPGRVRSVVEPAIRQWRFAPTVRNGVAVRVVVPITIWFRVSLWSEAPYFDERVSIPTERQPPDDFALLYQYGWCNLDTRTGTLKSRLPRPPEIGSVPVTLSADERQAVYAEMLRVGFFEYPVHVPIERREPRPLDMVVERTATHLVATVTQEASMPILITTLPPFRAEVMRRNVWTSVSWDSQITDGPALSREMAGARKIHELMRTILERRDITALRCTFTQ